MRLGDLLALIKQQPAALERAAELGRELVKLDRRRAEIVTELAGLGIDEQTTPQRPVLVHDSELHRAQTISVALEALAAPVLMTDRELFDEACRRIIPGSVQDLEEGRIDQEKFDIQVARRRDQIDQVMAELRRGTRSDAAPCINCGEPSTTLVAGNAYCDTHAASAPRLERPARFRS